MSVRMQMEVRQEAKRGGSLVLIVFKRNLIRSASPSVGQGVGVQREMEAGEWILQLDSREGGSLGHTERISQGSCTEINR